MRHLLDSFGVIKIVGFIRSLQWAQPSARPKGNTIKRTNMVRRVDHEKVWDVANRAFSVGIILARAVLPLSRIDDVNLPLRLGKAHETTGEGWDGVFSVEMLTFSTILKSSLCVTRSLVYDPTNHGTRVDKVDEVPIAHARRAVGDGT